MRATSALFGGPDDHQEVGPRGGEHAERVRARGTGDHQLGCGARGDLGHEKRRAGADGGSDKHDREGTPQYVIGPESHSSSVSMKW